MKIRIKDSSIRFRLTRPEVERLGGEWALAESTPLEPVAFRYGIRAGEDYGAHFEQGELWVEVPKEVLRSWAAGEEIGFDAALPNGLKILVEKDFQCLKPRADEPAEEYYPHPRVGGQPQTC